MALALALILLVMELVLFAAQQLALCDLVLHFRTRGLSLLDSQKYLLNNKQGGINCPQLTGNTDKIAGRGGGDSQNTQVKKK